jgi:hypothetical protein
MVLTLSLPQMTCRSLRGLSHPGNRSRPRVQGNAYPRGISMMPVMPMTPLIPQVLVHLIVSRQRLYVLALSLFNHMLSEPEQRAA